MAKSTKGSQRKKKSFKSKIIALFIIISLLLVGYFLLTNQGTGLITREPVEACKSPIVSDFSWQNKNAFYDQVSFLLSPQQRLDHWEDLEAAKKFVQLRVNNKYAATTYTDIKKVRSIDSGFMVTLDTKKLKSGAKQKIDITAINQLTKGRMCLTEREYVVSSVGEIEEITMKAEQDKELEKFPEIALADRIYYPSACKRQNFLDVQRGHKSSFQVNKVVCEGYMFGDEKTKAFRVDEPATRAELIRSLLLLADIVPSGDVRNQPYVDVPLDSEFVPYIQKAKDMKVLYSMAPDRKIQPDKYVSRVEAISVLVNLLGVDTETVKDTDFYLSGFQDVFPEMKHSKEVIWAFKAGLLPQYEDIDVSGRYFYPNDAMKREDLAHLIVQGMEVISKMQKEISAREPR